MHNTTWNYTNQEAQILAEFSVSDILYNLCTLEMVWNSNQILFRFYPFHYYAAP